MTDTPQTPSRRSKRYQPLVRQVHPDVWSDKSTFWTTDEPCYTRESVPEDYDALREDGSWQPRPDMRTAFYTSFARLKSARAPQSFRAAAPRSMDKCQVDDDTEVFSVGDTVCIKTEMARVSSIGVIVAMWELLADDATDVEGYMFICVHWFQRPTELPRVRPKREHHEVRLLSTGIQSHTHISAAIAILVSKNEIYYTLDTKAVLPPSNIVRHCMVSVQPPSTGEPAPPNSRHRREDYTSFYCRLALDSRKGIYYEFDWLHHRSAALAEPTEEQVSGRPWIVVTETSARKGRRRPRAVGKEALSPADSDVDSEYQESTGGDYDGDDDRLPSIAEDIESEIEPRCAVVEDVSKTTPRKRRRVTASPSKSTTTPRKPHTRRLAIPTPHSKAALRARARSRKAPVVRFPQPELKQEHYHQLQNLPQDPWLRAMHVLHVAARPAILPCREEEFNRVLRTVEELLEEGSGGCVCESFLGRRSIHVKINSIIDISGVPGTGKTATVHAVIRELKLMAQNAVSLVPFGFVLDPWFFSLVLCIIEHSVLFPPDRF